FLDAVHFALTPGIDIELNASARVGPRSPPGRTLASIALRYNLRVNATNRERCSSPHPALRFASCPPSPGGRGNGCAPPESKRCGPGCLPGPDTNRII